MRSKKRLIINVIFVIAILVALIIWVLVQGDIDDILKALETADYRYILVAVGFIVVYWITTSLSLNILMRKKAKISVKDAFNIGNLAHFYNGITPFASGGQPFQIYYYNRVGIKPNVSSGVIMMQFIIHQLVLNIMSIIAISIYAHYLFHEINSPVLNVAIIIGLTINFLVLFAIILISFSKKVKTFFLWIVGTAYKLKPLRNKREETLEKANSFFENFQKGFVELFDHIPTLFFSLLTKVISMFAYFIIPYFIFKSLGLEVDIKQMFFIIWMTAFAFIVMSFMPTPGASGGAEWAFSEVFISITGSLTLSMTSMLLWRFVTYYLTMISGAISALLVKRKEVVIDENRDLH